MRLISLLVVLFLSSGVLAQDYYLFIGTYTNGKSKGIYVYDFNATDGSAKPISVQEASNPSYLAIAPGGRFVYAVNENDGQEGEVSAYSFSRADGSLHFIDKVKSGGESPCFISLDHARNWAFVANYNGGNLAAFPINRDGSIAPLAELIQHMGTGPNKERQEKAHVHSAFLTPDEHFIFSADLGMDKIAIYRFNPGAKKPLSDAADSVVSLEPGSGPRHLAFHPTLPFVYVIDELSATVDAFQYGSGKPQHLQRISSVPAGFKGQNGSADIHVSPDGRFVYATNRGDANSIAVYKIDQGSGKLHLQGVEPVGGKHPRNFIIEPDGKYLLVANRDTDNIVIFAVNPKTGLLKPTGRQIDLPNPVCLKLLEK